MAFVDVDYLDTVRIDLKAHTQLGNDILVGSLEFAAHEASSAWRGAYFWEELLSCLRIASEKLIDRLFRATLYSSSSSLTCLD